MKVEALSSNVVNYLVWRYLQEAGYGNAALQLARCWNRDPESLPFAKDMSQHALINLLQDGLWFDKLQAEAGHGEQRYHFGRDHGKPYSARDGDLLTLDQGIPAHQLAEDSNGAVQEPPPRKGPGKRKKAKTNGIEVRMMNPQLNGDAMEIEQNGNTHVTNSVRAESEAMVSDAESPTVAELPISTLSIGQSTEIQTEQTMDLAPDTLFACSVKDLDPVVTQTLWGPSQPLLLLAGKSLLRLHYIPKDAGDGPKSQSVNLSLPLNNFSITSLCWISHGEVIVSAQEELVNEVGEIMKTNKLFKLIEGGEDYQVVSSTAGLVTTLRWNTVNQLLLAISSDGEKGSIKIWRDPGDNQFPAWTAFTDTAIFDAVWINDSTFVICGIEIFQIYEIADGILTARRKLETRVTWESVKYDSISGTVAALGIVGQTSYLGILHLSESAELQAHEYPDSYFTDFDFRPRPESAPLGLSSLGLPSPSSAILATCSASGVSRIWDPSQPLKCLDRLPNADDSLANNIAFSPDGSLLAAAGPDAVTVWDLNKREVPLATWRASHWDKDKWNPNIDGEFSLGWDPDGSRLSIALGNQIAIIPVGR